MLQRKRQLLAAFILNRFTMHNQLTEQKCYWMMITWACDRNTSVDLDQEKLRVSNTQKKWVLNRIGEIYVSNLYPRDFSYPITAALKNEKNLGTG